MELDRALAWAHGRRTGVLITIRKDGRPQSSDIAYAVMDGVLKISVTDDRAKTRNLVRDPRAVVHITSPDTWSYVSFDGTVELSDVTTVPGDAAGAELAEQYVAVTGGDHPDWDEYYDAMVAEGRRIIRFTPHGVTGQIQS